MQKTLNAINSDSDHVPCVQETSATYINNSYGGYKKSECGTTLKSSGRDMQGAENIVMFWNGEDVSTTLTGAFADDRMPDKGKLPCVIEEQPRNNQVYYQWHSHNVHAKTITDECSPTLLSGMGEGGQT